MVAPCLAAQGERRAEHLRQHDRAPELAAGERETPPPERLFAGLRRAGVRQHRERRRRGLGLERLLGRLAGLGDLPEDGERPRRLRSLSLGGCLDRDAAGGDPGRWRGLLAAREPAPQVLALGLALSLALAGLLPGFLGE